MLLITVANMDDLTSVTCYKMKKIRKFLSVYALKLNRKVVIKKTHQNIHIAHLCIGLLR